MADHNLNEGIKDETEISYKPLIPFKIMGTTFEKDALNRIS
jgi:hypothetical protein